MDNDERFYFAGIYKHHGGVKMRESSLARGQEVTRDFIIETPESSSTNGSSSGSSSALNGDSHPDGDKLSDEDNQLVGNKQMDTGNHLDCCQHLESSKGAGSTGVDSEKMTSLYEKCSPQDKKPESVYDIPRIQKPDSLPSALSRDMMASPEVKSEGLPDNNRTVAAKGEPNTPDCLENHICESTAPNIPANGPITNHTYINTNITGSVESPLSEKSGDSYEEVLEVLSPTSPQDDTRTETPVGFSKEISSSELDSLSSPSDNFLYGEIEKSLDSSRDDLITGTIELSDLTNNGDTTGSHKQKKFTQVQRQSTASPEGGLEVSRILKDLDKGSAVDTGGMLVGYGHRPINDDDDEGLAGSESRQSTPSGYHSDVTVPKHVVGDNEDVREDGPQPGCSGLQHPDACDGEDSLGANESSIDVVCVQPGPAPMMPLLYDYIPPGLSCLLDTGQLVVHMGNLRHDAVIDPGCRKRMEVVDETRRVMFYVEQGEPPFSEQSFVFHAYNRDRKEVLSVICPSSYSCICRGASWHWFKRCHFQAVIYAPVGIIAGFVRRSHTKFIQEFEILNAKEEIMLLLRGAPNDLEIYSPDLESELGRLAIHGWIGIMHEVRRTGQDYGLTFPLDLDVRIKAVLLGAIFAIDWLYSTRGGRIS